MTRPTPQMYRTAHFADVFTHINAKDIEQCLPELMKMFVSAWRMKKNRTHVQELVKRISALAPELEIEKQFARQVSDPTWDWSNYDYRNN